MILLKYARRSVKMNINYKLILCNIGTMVWMMISDV
jgi:hypothetical protein